MSVGRLKRVRRGWKGKGREKGGGGREGGTF